MRVDQLEDDRRVYIYSRNGVAHLSRACNSAALRDLEGTPASEVDPSTRVCGTC